MCKTSFLRKIFRRKKGAGKLQDYLLEISYGRGKFINLGYIKATETTLFDRVIEILKERPDFRKIKYYRITFPDGRRERYENPFYGEELEEEEEIEEEIVHGRKKRKKKTIEEIVDPVELLVDTSTRLRKAYGIVLEETLKLLPEAFKGVAELYTTASKEIIYNAVKQGVAEGIKALGEKLAPKSEKGSEFKEFFWELIKLRKEELKAKRERRRSVKVVEEKE